ncbi:ImmA/IrrE family metallo-endopeptidase [Massiliimalia timonensis]|uniref:ImmA/IrrE family metallo-endopeptidase n=1 Tax=Massiliimalia timonensis TaxID=1987501 RepID=UPI0018A04FE7|nr:ImmA/IrrE family metallo-endopeptidase [Massiliimalia timonensis]
MNDILELYREINNHDIIFELFSLNDTDSISIMDDHGACYIGMDPTRVHNLAEEKVTLAHEVGHCMTGSFYNRYSKLNDIEQKEHRADTWAVNKIIPFKKLEHAFQNGIVEVWELAEYFNVTEEFIYKSLAVYEEQDVYHRPVCEE